MKKSAVSPRTNGLAATGGMPMADLTVVEQASADVIRSRIFTIRGVQVMLAPDLADLYQVETRSFNQSVKRNLKRFPGNFRFQLTRAELEEVITICDNPDRLRFSPQLPFAFTEQGITMLSGVLNSDIAIQVSIRIMNIFVAMRRALASVAPLLARIEATDRRQIADQMRNDANQVHNEERFKLILDAMQDKKFPPLHDSRRGSELDMRLVCQRGRNLLSWAHEDISICLGGGGGSSGASCGNVDNGGSSRVGAREGRREAGDAARRRL